MKSNPTRCLVDAPPTDHYDNIPELGARQRLTPLNVLFCEGDVAETCYLVTKGCLKLSRLSAQGNEVIIRYVFSGELTAALAVLQKGIYPVSAQAVKATEVIALNKKKAMGLMYKYPDFWENLLTNVFDRLEDLQTRYLELSTEHVAQRIARVMLNLMHRTGQKRDSGVCINIPLSRQNIADYTGASLYTVSRILSIWEKCGWLKSSRQQITVINPDALVRLRET